MDRGVSWPQHARVAYCTAWRVFARELKARADRRISAMPNCRQRKVRHAGIPRPDPPRAAVCVAAPAAAARAAGCMRRPTIACCRVLPDGESVILVNEAGMVWEAVVSTGARARCRVLRGIGRDLQLSRIGCRALTVLGNGIVVGGERGEKDDTGMRFFGSFGEDLRDILEREQATALAAVGCRTFAVGYYSGDIVFLKYEGGLELKEVAHTSDADRHKGPVNEVVACGTRLASASDDRTAAVWDVETGERVAVLCGHGAEVNSVDMNETMVVTGSPSGGPCVRVFSVARGYSCISHISTSAVVWVHMKQVSSVRILDRDHVLSACVGGTIAISAMMSHRVIARVQLHFEVLSTDVLADGAVVACGRRPDGGEAVIIPPPPAAASLLQAYGASRRRQAQARSCGRQRPALELLTVEKFARHGVNRNWRSRLRWA